MHLGFATSFSSARSVFGITTLEATIVLMASFNEDFPPPCGPVVIKITCGIFGMKVVPMYPTTRTS
ncbi:MAG: hypothetical protein QXU98_02840 [Candidatus Parvarchaeota archaeon]